MIAALLVLVAFASVNARSHYIVNGRDAVLGAYPWQASLQYEGSHFCGGALISSEYVLTAAHCITMGPQGGFKVVLGLHDQKRSAGQPEEYDVESTVAHADFSMPQNGKFITNDIAIIKLAQPYNTGNAFAQVIEMAEEGDNFDDGECKLTGWGRLSGFGNKLPDILQEVDTTAISTASCSKLWKSWMPGMSFTMEQSQICFYNGKGGACQGDSGGPAICKKDGNWVLAGVTSGGSPVCNVKKPSVYTRVSEFRDWISENTGGVAYRGSSGFLPGPCPKGAWC